MIETKAGRRPRGSKEATRKDLLEAAKKIIRTQGVAALSTVSVTREAGLAQSGFYAHFGNMDECLQAAAKEIAGTIRTSISQQRRQLYTESLGSHEATVEFYRSLLELFQRERHVSQILLHNQGDRTPLGKSMRAVMKSIRLDFTDDLWSVGKDIGLKAQHRRRVELLAEFILGSVIAAVSSVLDGRNKDIDFTAEELAAMSGAASEGLLRRCLDTST